MKKNEALPELTIELQGTEVFFSIAGERRLKMTAENFLGAINSVHMGDLAWKASRPQEDFSGLGVEQYVATERLLKKKLSMDQAAMAQKIPVDRLRKFYYYALQNLNGSGCDAERKRQESVGHDFCLIKPTQGPDGRTGSPQYRFLDLDGIWPLLKLGMSPAEIADKAHLDREDFGEWLTVNRPLMEKFLR